MSEKLVLIDGHSILNRAFFGIPDLTNSEGLGNPPPAGRRYDKAYGIGRQYAAVRHGHLQRRVELSPREEEQQTAVLKKRGISTADSRTEGAVERAGRSRLNIRTGSSGAAECRLFRR